MAFYEHAAEFAGLPVIHWTRGDALTDPAQHAYRISLDYPDWEAQRTWPDLLAEFLDQPGADQVSALVIGVFANMFEGGQTSSAEAIAALVAARDRLPHLKAIFLGDILSEECEISWIVQSDVSPLFNAFPQLGIFQVRGGARLSLGTLHNAPHLKTLIVETGGLNVSVVQQVARANLPELTHLELYLGTAMYGANTEVDDIRALLDAAGLPKLAYLGLRDSDIVDQFAPVVAQHPILNRIKVLDLSLGTLTNAGAQALLDSALIRNLDKLDLHHHFCTPSMVERLNALPIEVDASDAQQSEEDDGDVWRFVAVSE